jgi:hypothetical protein
MSLTADQIIALAPDASAIKSGKDLAVVTKWQLRGASDNAIWGHCQGSGKLPYQTQIDLHNIAFKCSCPSRKFPCKHGLGLFLLFSKEPGSFTKGKEPDWVTDWLNKRSEKTTKKTNSENKPIDTVAQAKRTEAREKKVNNGILDLHIWLKDIIRNGLISLPERSYDYWQNPAKRLIDAQAPGLANMVKSLGKINYFNDSWKYEVLNQLSRIYLVSESYLNLQSLPEVFQQEIKTLTGFAQSKEELLSQEGINDQWLVLARKLEDDEQLTVEQNWLYGLKTKKFALILQFYANRQLPELNLIPGTTIHAELVFYRGVNTYRALVKQQQSTGNMLMPEFYTSISSAIKEYSRIITENPLLDRVPMLIGNVRFTGVNNQYFLIDKGNEAYKVNVTESVAIRILSLTGGKACQFFIFINEEEAEPLAVWENSNFITLNHAIQK